MSDIVTASERIDQLQASIVELEQQLAAEKARADHAEEIVATQQKQIGLLIDGRNAEGLLKLKAEAAVAEMRDAAFCHCGKPAACLVRYEGDGPVQFACDECCGHGNEDGWCKRLDDCGSGPALAAH